MASIRKRPDRAGWQVRWRENGKSPSETFASYEEAVKFRGLVDAAGQRLPPGWVPGRGFIKEDAKGLTLAEWFPRALATRTKASSRTKEDYERDFRKHVPDWLAKMQLADIGRAEGGLWIEELRTTKGRDGFMSKKTLSNVHGLVSSVLNDAVLDGKIPRNPFKGQLKNLELVEGERREMVIVTPAEVRAIIREMHPHYRDFVATIYGTGMRFSEATALGPEHADIQSLTLRVTRAWKRRRGGDVLGPPKSRRSIRNVSITKALGEALEPRLAQEYLFLNTRGTRITHGNFYAKFWTPAVASSGIGKAPRVHDLRHSHAALLISRRVPMLAVSRRLGHASIQVTMDVYGHLLPEVDDGIRDLLEDE